MTERVLICGSRDWGDAVMISRVIQDLPGDAVIIHGGAPGADTMAGIAAKMYGHAVLRYDAEWTLHGRAAGPIRNRQMLVEGKPTRVIAFRCRGASPGTDNMIEQARRAGLPVEIHRPETGSVVRIEQGQLL